MKITRRRMLKAGALGLAAPAAASILTSELAPPASAQQTPQDLPESFAKLQPLGERVKPITVEEFQGRIEQAQRLMQESKPRFAATYLAPGSSMYYYTGIRWGGGERLFSLVIPAKGEALIVCPGFEEGRARELLRWPIEVRVWQEDENPYGVVAGWLRERGARSGRMRVLVKQSSPMSRFRFRMQHNRPPLRMMVQRKNRWIRAVCSTDCWCGRDTTGRPMRIHRLRVWQ